MRRKSHPSVALTAPKELDLEQLQILKDREWDKVVAAANVEYNAAMLGAWNRYVTALKADPTKPGDKMWGTHRDYDEQYDQDRIAAVRRFNRATGKLLD